MFCTNGEQAAKRAKEGFDMVGPIIRIAIHTFRAFLICLSFHHVSSMDWRRRFVQINVISDSGAMADSISRHLALAAGSDSGSEPRFGYWLIMNEYFYIYIPNVCSPACKCWYHIYDGRVDDDQDVDERFQILAFRFQRPQRLILPRGNYDHALSPSRGSDSGSVPTVHLPASLDIVNAYRYNYVSASSRI